MHNGENGNISLLISILLGVTSFILGNIDVIMKICVALASIAAAVMALRFHYYATKERQQQIILNDKQEKRNLEQEKRNLEQEKRNLDQAQDIINNIKS